MSALNSLLLMLHLQIVYWKLDVGQVRVNCRFLDHNSHVNYQKFGFSWDLSKFQSKKENTRKKGEKKKKNWFKKYKLYN